MWAWDLGGCPIASVKLLPHAHTPVEGQSEAGDSCAIDYKRHDFTLQEAGEMPLFPVGMPDAGTGDQQP